MLRNTIRFIKTARDPGYGLRPKRSVDFSVEAYLVQEQHQAYSQKPKVLHKAETTETAQDDSSRQLLFLDAFIRQ